MTEEQAPYSSASGKHDYWVAGWMLAKYEKHTGYHPVTINECLEWWEGFTKGTVEAAMYDYIDSHFDRLMIDFQETKQLIINARNTSTGSM